MGMFNTTEVSLQEEKGVKVDIPVHCKCWFLSKLKSAAD